MSFSEPLPLRGTLTRASLFFLYLAFPALLVVQEVRSEVGIYWTGMFWGFSITLLWMCALAFAGSRRSMRYALCVFVSLFVLLNMALSLSFLIQGTAFNTAFFSHLDLSTLQIALRTDGARMLAAIVYILAAPVVTYWAIAHRFYPGGALGRVPVAIKAATKIGLAGLAVWTSYPITAMYQHYITTTQASARLMTEIGNLQARPASQVALSQGDTRNLVLIYVESLESNYLDEALFPGLTPNLNALALEGQWFRDMHQYPGTGWTIGAMVSTQCGVPLLSERNGNMVLGEVDNPFGQITCLAEYLQGAGYKTAFVGGASLDFAGKGNFLRDNGYDVALGIDELPNATGHSWGMYDDAMFMHFTDLFDGLTETGEPFLLTALTLDTHHPSGTPSPSCAPYQGSTDTMLNAVHCADQLLNDVVAHIRASPDASNTVIAIVSDHLLIQGSPKDALSAKERRNLFFMLDQTRPARQITGSAVHFDVAPTLMDALGFDPVEFAFGHSILANELGWVFERELTEADFEAFKIEQLLETAGQ